MTTVRLLRRRVHLMSLALLVSLATPTHSMDLMQAWQGALQHAPDAALARAQREAGAAQERQARALWRPSAFLEGGAAYANAQTSTQGAQFSAPGFGQSSGVAFDTSVNGGTATRYALALRQPIYSRERNAQSDALDTGARAAEIQWQQSRAELMLTTTQACFDVTLATSRLKILRLQQESATRAAEQARDRFRAGDRPVTEVHEADARAAALSAQVLLAQTQLTLAHSRLTDLTGLATDSDTVFELTNISAARAAIAPLADWLARIDHQSPAIQLAQAQLDAAEARAHASSSAFAPIVDLVARVARDDINGNGAFGNSSSSSVNSAIGVQVAVPLYTGGLRSAQSDESQARVLAARAELDRTRQLVVQQARGTWLDLSLADQQIDALQAAVDASHARLGATRTGLQAGDRTTLDLLNAENDAAAAELTLLETRVRLLIERLRLSAQAGELDETVLQQAQAQMQPPSPNH